MAGMNIRVLFFSVLQDITSTSAIDLCCEGCSTVGDLMAMLMARWPALEAWDTSLLIAVDQAYVKRSASLHEGAEVALMPPVQGG
jgi:molybdopterin converting factor small subunit